MEIIFKKLLKDLLILDNRVNGKLSGEFIYQHNILVIDDSSFQHNTIVIDNSSFIKELLEAEKKNSPFLKRINICQALAIYDHDKKIASIDYNYPAKSLIETGRDRYASPIVVVCNLKK